MQPRLWKGMDAVLQRSCLQDPLGHPFLPRLQQTLASRSAAGQGFVPAAIAAMAFFLALLCLAPLCTLLMLVCSPTVLTNILSAKLVL